MHSYRKSLLIATMWLVFISACKGQVPNSTEKKVGGAFENSSYTYSGMPENINATDTSAAWKLNGQKLLLTGIVYKRDGKTPAPDVILYYYQTNTEGNYIHKPEEPQSMRPNSLGQTHGYIRGWVKTGIDGKYSIYTVRPGSYPDFIEPAHIHLTVKEPNDINEYYIDDAVFDDDKLLTSAKRKKMKNRGGNGTLRLVQKNELMIGERNIVLGLNIPEHPLEKINNVASGNEPGEDVFSFTPFHAWGPDKGSKTCPICKYGSYHGILYFVGNNPDWNEIKKWLTYLETESGLRTKHLKVYFIYGNESNYSKKQREFELEKIGNELDLKKTALTFVPSFSDHESEINLNNVDQNIGNTFILYRRSRIIDKYINLKPTEENFQLLKKRLDETINEYYNLPKLMQ